MRYVLVLGTSDKDTGKPVFTQAEALEKAREILKAHFASYTIREAYGVSSGDGNAQREAYTLVICLPETTEDAVYAAADELIAAFNQSAVQIQKTQTATESYSAQ